MQMANTERNRSGENTSISNSLDHLGMHLIKDFKTLKKKLKIPEDGKVSHTHGLVALIAEIAILPKSNQQFY